MEPFVECHKCAIKSGSPILCPDCLKRRAEWNQKEREERQEGLWRDYYNGTVSKNYPCPICFHPLNQHACGGNHWCHVKSETGVRCACKMKVNDLLPKDIMTNRDELFELHKELCEAALDIMKAKNADYTNHDVDDPLANFRIAHKQGHVKSVAASIFIRLGDKFTRISTLLQKDALVRDEGIHDTIRDAVNYLILLSYALEKEKDATL